MRVLYIDVDSLRPDHLGCYGYHRNTSPNIDALAREAVRFTNCYVTDAPCLPSRTALWSGRFGFRTGVVGHGGTAAAPFPEGGSRQFSDTFGQTGWMSALRRCGMQTATVSPFAERHAAWHWYAGYNDICNTGRCGNERAEEICHPALDWLDQHAERDNWFLHVNFWEPHTPYRTAMDFGDPFADAPLPAWLTEDVRQRCWDGYGPHSAREPHGYGRENNWCEFPRLPQSLDSMDAVRRWINGYDTGIRYADEYIGRLIDQLERRDVLDETVIVIGADHGENQGELNIWGDHQTADDPTCRVPLLIRWPGLSPRRRVDNALLYHFDWAATLIELLGGDVPENWDGRSFAGAFKAGRSEGRDALVTGQGAWACQRGVRFDHAGDAYLYLATAHDGYKMLAPELLFNLSRDPHQQADQSAAQPGLVREGAARLAEWLDGVKSRSRTGVDPYDSVIAEGGPYHTRGLLSAYCKRLRDTGRGHHADALAARHPGEL